MYAQELNWIGFHQLTYLCFGFWIGEIALLPPATRYCSKQSQIYYICSLHDLFWLGKNIMSSGFTAIIHHSHGSLALSTTDLDITMTPIFFGFNNMQCSYIVKFFARWDIWILSLLMGPYATTYFKKTISDQNLSKH